MENGGLLAVYHEFQTVLRFLLFFTLRVRLFCQIHGLTVFLNERMEKQRSYGGLPCNLDRVKTV